MRRDGRREIQLDIATDEMPMDTDECGENIVFYLCPSDFLSVEIVNLHFSRRLPRGAFGTVGGWYLLFGVLSCLRSETHNRHRIKRKIVHQLPQGFRREAIRVAMSVSSERYSLL